MRFLLSTLGAIIFVVSQVSTADAQVSETQKALAACQASVRTSVPGPRDITFPEFDANAARIREVIDVSGRRYVVSSFALRRPQGTAEQVIPFTCTVYRIVLPLMTERGPEYRVASLVMPDDSVDLPALRTRQNG